VQYAEKEFEMKCPTAQCGTEIADGVLLQFVGRGDNEMQIDERLTELYNVIYSVYTQLYISTVISCVLRLHCAIMQSKYIQHNCTVIWLCIDGM